MVQIVDSSDPSTGPSTANTATPPSTGPSTTSSSNTGTTATTSSQASTFDTQPPSSQDESQEPPGNIRSGPKAWGQLMVINDNRRYELCEDEYVVGRAKGCDILLTAEVKPTEAISLWNACSKKHFRVYNQHRSNGRFAFLQDLSSNGTLVNRDSVGKGQHIALNSGDNISLVKKDNLAFLYISYDTENEKEDDIPEAVRERYRFVKELGRGACGVVKQAVTRKSDTDAQVLACKFVEKSSFTFIHSSRKQDLTKEVDIMSRLNHPCIVKVVDVIDSEKTLYIFMELVSGGDLFTIIKKDCIRLEEDHAKRLLYQIIKAVKYLHDNKVVHRDLKPENILLTSSDPDTQIVKVTDFGLSKLVESQSLLSTLCGTPSYLAPEVLANFGEGRAAYTKAVDCWSIGVILYVCITGQPAFTNERRDTTLNLMQQIVNGNYLMKDKYWDHMPQARDLVTKLLTVNPEHRLSLEDALRHPWFQDSKMLEQVNQLIDAEKDRTSTMKSRVRPSEFTSPEPKRRKVEGVSMTKNRSDASTPLLPGSNPSLSSLGMVDPMDTSSLPQQASSKESEKV